ncbi:transcriptional regulator GcvA [Massilia sp. CF038]|uniref:transcriptional regulator GcvA n=1 Tax=Massilia sp. CF038 TaxID=1881045 RepID=UPI00090FC5EA|nr:transcriptional regulator GcvA [Massilia sp. CF038]SHH41159.1 transcriptional regulator, LysR family [Massilia sp. CF038]
MAARPNPPLIAARSFEAAARHASFLKAADELNVTPTAISHQVKKLEQYLGQALFVRLNRAVQLTAEGAALAATLHTLFASLDQALDPRRRAARSTIVISAMPSLAGKWLAPRLGEFEALYPQWRVLIDVEDKLVDFKSSNIDMALRYGPGKYPGLHARRWMGATIVPVCSPALLQRTRLRQPADLRRHNLIHNTTAARRVRPPEWEEWLAAHGVEGVDATAGPLFTSTYMALEAAQAGHGVTLAPAPLVERDLADGRLVKPLALEMANPWSFWIVCPRQNLQDEKIKALTAWLLQQART